MEWENKIPRWGGQIEEPPEGKKNLGYLVGDRPPAHWENWLRKGTYEAVKENREAIEECFTSVGNGKQEVATAITDKGVATSGSDTFGKMATNIGKIETDLSSGTTATSGDLLSGKTAYSKGLLLIGSMVNRGNVANTVTTQNGSYTIPSGYHSGAGKVTANFPNLVAGNIKSGVTVGGVTGNLVTPIKASSKVLEYRVEYSTNHTEVVPMGLNVKAAFVQGTDGVVHQVYPVIDKSFTVMVVKGNNYDLNFLGMTVSGNNATIRTRIVNAWGGDVSFEIHYVY